MGEPAIATDREVGRREQRRKETLREITATARRLLVREGSSGVTLRAIARELGMTAPALYRYFDSHESLVTALAADLYHELADALERARDAEPDDDVGARLRAASRAFRSWSLANRPEFGLLFANPMTDPTGPAADDCEAAGHRFGLVFGRLFSQLWHTRPFPVPDRADLSPVLVRQLEGWEDEMRGGMPIPAVYVFLRCWTALYGTVTMEVFGHLGWALEDTEPIFEATLQDNLRLLALDA
jgi:AcrR family transcriptional regulator